MDNSNQKSLIEKNILNLRSHFKVYYPEQASIKVLENCGDCAYVIKFNHSNATDLNVTLQIQSKIKINKFKFEFKN